MLLKKSNKLLLHLPYLTDNRLSFIGFFQDDIAKIIQNLDPNETLDDDSISILTLKFVVLPSTNL